MKQLVRGANEMPQVFFFELTHPNSPPMHLSGFTSAPNIALHCSERSTRFVRDLIVGEIVKKCKFEVTTWSILQGVEEIASEQCRNDRIGSVTFAALHIDGDDRVVPLFSKGTEGLQPCNAGEESHTMSGPRVQS